MDVSPWQHVAWCSLRNLVFSTLGSLNSVGSNNSIVVPLYEFVYVYV